MSEYYVPNKLLSMRDVDGNVPTWRLLFGNRTAGKTFGVKKVLAGRALRGGFKFAYLTRFIDDVPSVFSGFWKDIGPLKFPEHEMTQKPLLRGKAAELFIDGRSVGYVLAINDPERIKRNSSLFADIDVMFLDEFQSETGKYVPDEIKKLNSILISVARGGASGAHTRHVEIWACSNNVTIFNPYFLHFGIGTQLQNRTKFLRGKGWVAEQTYNEKAAKALEGEFAGAMSVKELQYAAHNVWLLDNNKFVHKIKGDKYPICNVKYNGKLFGIWDPLGEGFIYVSQKASEGAPVIVCNSLDHSEGTTLTPRSNLIVKNLRNAYMTDAVRFDSQAAKNSFLALTCMTDY